MSSREYPIIIIGPPTEKYILNIAGQPYVLNTEQGLFPAEELARITPFFRGRPCYKDHSAESKPGEFTRFGVKIGNIVESHWDNERLSICGILRVSNETWIETFSYGPLTDYHFSAVVDTHVIKHGQWHISYPSVIYGVDMVDFGAAGGRFDVPMTAQRRKTYNDILGRMKL